MAIDGFAGIDFQRFHEQVLPDKLQGAAGAEASKALGDLHALAFRRPDGSSFSYRPERGRVEIESGDDAAATVIEIDHADWEGLVHDYESVAGLLYSNRIRCARGDAMDFMAWEPVLRALYADRPIYDPAEPLYLPSGRELDPERAFRPEDDEQEMADFFQTAGYLVVRGLFTAGEVAGFLEEARALREEAMKGDKMSWWTTTPEGEEICCRVTRAREKPRLSKLYGAPRLQRLADLADVGAQPRPGEGSGVTCIYKTPGVEEGLSDLPWHRDCGLGGHALMCPTMVASLFLTPATRETGWLRFLPGSARASSAFRDATDSNGPSGVGVCAEAGDVTLHFGDLMHSAPPPGAAGLSGYRVSAITGFGPPGLRPHTGDASYNQVLHQRPDGQIENLRTIAGRA